MGHVAWYVQFQVLNNLENATRFIEIRHTKLGKAVCIHLYFLILIKIKEKKSVDFFNSKKMNILKFTIYAS